LVLDLLDTPGKQEGARRDQVANQDRRHEGARSHNRYAIGGITRTRIRQLRGRQSAKRPNVTKMYFALNSTVRSRVCRDPREGGSPITADVAHTLSAAAPHISRRALISVRFSRTDAKC
jgi:hypothetical protein